MGSPFLCGNTLAPLTIGMDGPSPAERGMLIDASVTGFREESRERNKAD